MYLRVYKPDSNHHHPNTHLSSHTRAGTSVIVSVLSNNIITGPSPHQQALAKLASVLWMCLDLDVSNEFVCLSGHRQGRGYSLFTSDGLNPVSSPPSVPLTDRIYSVFLVWSTLACSPSPNPHLTASMFSRVCVTCKDAEILCHR